MQFHNVPVCHSSVRAPMSAFPRTRRLRTGAGGSSTRISSGSPAPMGAHSKFAHRMRDQGERGRGGISVYVGQRNLPGAMEWPLCCRMPCSGWWSRGPWSRGYFALHTSIVSVLRWCAKQSAVGVTHALHTFQETKRRTGIKTCADIVIIICVCNSAN